MQNPATIYALASAPGKAGVAVLRISGPHARKALAALGVTEPLKPRHATLITLHAPTTRHQALGTRHLIDRALAIFFPSPYSFTGEDIVELHTHGSRAIIKLLLEALGSISGLRLAEAGEFTRRAFMNGKLDLLEAEGLGDLIDADSPAQHAQAMRQLGGELSTRVMGLREQILIPLALLEAYIDFPDEEIPESVLVETTQRVEALIKEIQMLLDDGRIGEKIRDGLQIVIFGPPNAGKSSLMNAIARRDVAIVSPEAGTTRDLIEIQLEIGGYAATLVDTAGLREATGAIEAEGVRRAQNRIETADIKIAAFDIVTIPNHLHGFRDIIDDNTIIVANKCDLMQKVSKNPYPNEKSTIDSLLAPPSPPLSVSAKTGEGFDLLFARLTQRIETLAASAPSPLITRARHREAFHQALAALTRFQMDAPLEIMCEELRVAATAIGKITGKILVDDLLDVVFSRFCIGK